MTKLNNFPPIHSAGRALKASLLAGLLSIGLSTSAAARTIRVASSTPMGGRVFIENTTGGSLTSTGSVGLVAIPYGGYQFKGWKDAATGNIVSTALRLTDSGTADRTLVGVFAHPAYPAMQRTFTANVSQQNRYLKSVTTTGTQTPTVFAATSTAELPYTAFSTVGTYTDAGAVIDKTATPIVVAQGTAQFTLNFKAWTDAIDGHASELNWAQQAVFVDWNGNGSFADANEVYARNSSADPPFSDFVSAEGYTRTLTIPPATAQPGDYRMRVVYNEPETSATDWPASIFASSPAHIRNGVAYDFTLRIQENNSALWNVAVYNKTGGKAAESGTQNIDSLKFTTTDVSMAYKNGGAFNKPLSEIDSLAVQSSTLPATPLFSGILPTELIYGNRSFSLNYEGSDAVYWTTRANATPDSLYSAPVSTAGWSAGAKTVKAVAVKGGKLSNIAELAFTIRANQTATPVVSTADAPRWYKLSVGLNATSNRAGRLLSHNTKNAYPTTTTQTATADSLLWRLEGTSLSSVKLANRLGEYIILNGNDVNCSLTGSAASATSLSVDDNSANSPATYRFTSNGTYLHPGTEGRTWSVLAYNDELSTNSAWQFTPIYNKVIKLPSDIQGGTYGVGTAGTYNAELFEGGSVNLVCTPATGTVFLGWSTDGGVTALSGSNVATYTVRADNLTESSTVTYTPMFNTNYTAVPLLSTAAAPVWYKISVAKTALNGRAGRLLSHNTKYNYPTTTDIKTTADSVLWRLEGSSLAAVKVANRLGEYLVASGYNTGYYFRSTYAEGSTFAIEDNSSNSASTYRFANGGNYMHPGSTDSSVGLWAVIGYNAELNTNTAWQFTPVYSKTITVAQNVIGGSYGVNATGTYRYELFNGDRTNLVCTALTGATFRGWSTDGGTTVISGSNVSPYTITANNLTASSSVTYTPVFNTSALPPTPTISFSETNATAPYCRGYINISSTVTNAKIEYQVNDGTWTTYTDKINIKTLNSGRNAFNVKVTDPATSLSIVLNEYITYDGSDAQDPKSWMDHISNNVNLSRLSIPGTHETCATGGTAWHKCQNNSITDQLNLGVRVLDFRIGDDFQMYHSTTGMGIYFYGAITEVANFLKAHPSEFVMVSIKDENWNGTQADWSREVGRMMDETGVAYTTDDSRDYTMGELRGKFIILRRYGDFGSTRGISPSSWPNDWYGSVSAGSVTLRIQDAYNYGAELVSSAGGRKWGYVQNFLNEARDNPTNGQIYLNFLNGTGISTPGAWANNINPRMSTYLDGNPKARLGIIMMDFVGSYTGLPAKIYNANKYPQL